MNGLRRVSAITIPLFLGVMATPILEVVVFISSHPNDVFKALEAFGRIDLQTVPNVRIEVVLKFRDPKVLLMDPNLLL